MMLRRLYESPFVRFAVVGGVATAVNYAVYVVLVRCFDDLWPALAYFCAAVRFSGRLSGQFPDGALRPARAFEILKKRTLPCDARQGLLLHLFGCSLGYFLILGSSSPYFFFRSSALSQIPSSIASTPHATKISIGRV